MNRPKTNPTAQPMPNSGLNPFSRRWIAPMPTMNRQKAKAARKPGMVHRRLMSERYISVLEASIA